MLYFGKLVLFSARGVNPKIFSAVISAFVEPTILETMISPYIYSHWMMMQVKMNAKVYVNQGLFHVLKK